MFFRSSQETGRLVELIDRNFEWFRERYHRALHALLDTWPVVIVMSLLLVLVLLACFKFTRSELAPEEDQGIVLAHIQGPPNATAQQMQTYADQVFQTSKQEPEYAQMFQITGVPTVNQGIGGVLFKPWDKRTRSAHQMQLELQQKWAQIAGAQVFAFQFPPLPGSSGYPVQFVITTTESFQNLNDVAQAVVAKAFSQHAFYFADIDLKLDKPQATLEVDRDKVAALGLSQSDVGSALGAALGGGYVNYFSIAGRSYKVIPQVQQVDRLKSRAGTRLLHPHSLGTIILAREHRGAHQVFRRTRVDQSVSAVEFGDDRRCQRHVARRDSQASQYHDRAGRWKRVNRGLRGSVAPVHPRIRGFFCHPRLRDRHRVFGARRAV